MIFNFCQRFLKFSFIPCNAYFWCRWLNKLSSTSQPLIKRNAFQILFANCFPCWHKSSSNIKSFPAAELSNKPTLTPSAPYVSISFKASGEFPNDFENYKITDKYISMVEKQIRDKPEYYFWTHNRFKHKNKAPKD